MLLQPRRIETDAGTVETLGDATLLSQRKLGLICSRRCPGDPMLKTYDFARLARVSGVPIVSGFHSPVEKDCLPILLRGRNPIIIVQAHGLSSSRLRIEWRKAIETGRLLLLSPFSAKQKRITSKLAIVRNEFVAALCSEVLIPFAAPNSESEALGVALLKSGTRVYTFSDHPGPLLDSGALVVGPDFLTRPGGDHDYVRDTKAPC